MINPSAFKRRLLRAAVQDNIDVIQNNWLRLLPQARARRPAWLSRGVVFIVGPVLFSLLYAVATVSKEHRGVATPLPPVATVTEIKAPASLATPAWASGASVAPASPESLQPADKIATDVDSVSAPPLAMLNPESLVPAPGQVDFKALALPVKKIVIDPGHGGDDPGAVSYGMTEKALALDIGLRLRALLEDSSFDVRMTREKDQTMSLVKRAAFANDEGGDLFVSIHVNWIKPRRARVVETYYLGPSEDSAILRLAGVENQHSGYSLTDFRRLLDGVYTDVKRGESRKLAEAIQGELVRALRETNPTLRPRAAKTAPFLVLVGATMPAILTEVACLSNNDEAQLLTNPRHRQHIARALFAGIRAYTDTLYHAYMMRKDAPS